MARIIIVYGVIGGIIVAIGMWVSMSAQPEGGGALGMVVGYLTMLIALSTVFVGIKRYRDTACGGVIRFLPALGLGLAIALIASAFYVLAWELWMFRTNYTFVDVYIAKSLEAMRVEGKSSAEIAAFARDMAAMKVSYADPIYRMAITLSEIAPIAVLVATISAAVLRNSRAFPAVAPRA
jgi:hypothetical protein